VYRTDSIGKRRDKNKTSCDYTSLRRVHAGADGLSGPDDEIKYTQYLQLYIEPVFWLNDPYCDL